MTRREVRFSPRFNKRFDELQVAGRLTLLRTQALADAIEALAVHPFNPDGVLDEWSEPHWIKICRAAGDVDTGLRVVYLLHEDGSVRADDLVLILPDI